MKRLVESQVEQGMYDPYIERYVDAGFSVEFIKRKVMNITNGHENPEIVENRIRMIIRR